MQRDYWDSEAQVYDDLYQDAWSKLEDDYSGTILETMISGIESPEVIDLGCGTGLVATLLERSGKQFQYAGVDISPKMIEEASEKHPEREFILADIADLDEEFLSRFNLIVGLNGPISYIGRETGFLEKIRVGARQDAEVFATCYGRYALSRLLRLRFGVIGYRPTRKSRFRRGSPVLYYSKRGLEKLFEAYGYKEVSVFGMSVFGRVAEYPFLWALDQWLAKLVPNLAHTLIVTAKVKK